MTGPTSSSGRPEAPFRGLEPYRFCDEAIFFERETDLQKLRQLTTIYRASLLYGESGVGKSSLLNAGLLPLLVRDGVSVERVRVQPRPGREFVIERIQSSADGEVLPSRLADPNGEGRTVLSVASFMERLAGLPADPLPLLVFDQFEELLTATSHDSGGPAVAAHAAQSAIIECLASVVLSKQPVRLLFVFREDYLAKFDRFFYYCPELPDRFLRLASPTVESLQTLIRGPFETAALPKGYWKKEITPALAGKLELALRPGYGRVAVNLTHVQIAALQLWRDDKPDETLARRGVDGLITDYLEGALTSLGGDRSVAEGLLAALITKEGTRRVLLETEAVDQIVREDGVRESSCREVLERLVAESKLVRRDYNRDSISYEISSEFLVGWIRTLKLERDARLALKRRLKRIVGAFATAAVVLGLVFWQQYRTVTVVAQRDALVERYRNERDAAEARAAEANATLRASTDSQVSHLAGQVIALESSTKKLTERAEVLDGALSRASDELLSLRNERQKWQGAQFDLEAAQQQVANLSAEATKLRSELSGLRADNNSLRNEVSTLKTENAGLLTENRRLAQLPGGTAEGRPAPGSLSSSKSTSAEEDYQTGRRYLNGRSASPKGEVEALKWFQKAADQGHAAAQASLGLMYERGRGVQKNEAEAAKWYHKSAEQGNPIGQFNLGLLYADGRGVTKDDQEAVRWYRLAAEQGNAAAQNNLGLMYATGRGVAKDDLEAAKWYRKAADQGNAAGQFNMGRRHSTGSGVPKDDKEAFQWYRKAADQGHAGAQSALGRIYSNGTVVGRDYRVALQWYRMAAKQDHVEAQNNLAWLLATVSDSSIRNGAEAVQWAEKACGATSYANATYMDTLAAAYAEAKSWAKAVEVQSKAADLASAGSDADLTARIQARLELYRERKPFRQ